MARKPQSWNQFELPKALRAGFRPVDGETYVSNRGRTGEGVMVYSAKFECWIHFRPKRKESGRPRPYLMYHLSGVQQGAKIRLVRKRLRARFSLEELAAEYSRVSKIELDELPGSYQQVDRTELAPTPREVFPPKAKPKKTTVKKAPVKQAVPKTDWPAEMPPVDKVSQNGYTNDLDELRYAFWDWVHNVHAKDYTFTEPEMAEIDRQLREIGCRPRTRSVTLRMEVPDGIDMTDINAILKDKNIALTDLSVDRG